VFVAKREVATWPIFGLLARLQRSVFVDRTRRHKVDEVNAEIAERLAEGDPVVLFAEGTSSDGNRVLPFRTALIGAARDALAKAGGAEQIYIQPLSIAYTGLLGLPMGRQHRPTAAWYGSLDLIPHLTAVMRRGALDAVITWGETIVYDGGTDRKLLAKQLETAVRRHTVAALRGHSFLSEKPL
jgi:1-acyl-sn-glycerol-3-phosphate acyltransferase